MRGGIGPADGWTPWMAMDGMDAMDAMSLAQADAAETRWCARSACRRRSARKRRRPGSTATNGLPATCWTATRLGKRLGNVVYPDGAWSSRLLAIAAIGEFVQAEDADGNTWTDFALPDYRDYPLADELDELAELIEYRPGVSARRWPSATTSPAISASC